MLINQQFAGEPANAGEALTVAINSAISAYRALSRTLPPEERGRVITDAAKLAMLGLRELERQREAKRLAALAEHRARLARDGASLAYAASVPGFVESLTEIERFVLGGMLAKTPPWLARRAS